MCILLREMKCLICKQDRRESWVEGVCVICFLEEPEKVQIIKKKRGQPL